MARARKHAASGLAKCPTGIQGLDEITQGGLPRGRPTLVCGAAGSGKTLFAMEFLVRGITQYQEPGVFLSFEETAEELTANMASLGFELPALILANQLAIDYVHMDRGEIQEIGEYDLEGLFVRLGTAIDEVRAKRMAIDTVEALFSGLANERILRAELRRLFRWLKDREVTAVITSEQGQGQLTRHGLEEYVSDCVIVLDHRVQNQIATRRLRVVKYRGSSHGTNEYPALIDAHGLAILPISSLDLNYPVSSDRFSSGIDGLDAMLGGQGFYKGSSILVSGTAGTGKTSLAVAFADAVCRSGGTVLYTSFEESPEQILRNMRSIGYDLEPWRKAGRLHFHSVRPTIYGLEMHLATLHQRLGELKPVALVVDPITNLVTISNRDETRVMLIRLFDFVKRQGITGFYISLTGAVEAMEQSEVGISSLMDTWLLLRVVESNGERNRVLYVLKSRGMAHSDQMREYWLTPTGVQLQDVYLGAGQVLTGAARLAQEQKDQAAAIHARPAAEEPQRDLAQELAAVESQIAALSLRLNDLTEELRTATAQEKERDETLASDQEHPAAPRQAD